LTWHQYTVGDRIVLTISAYSETAKFFHLNDNIVRALLHTQIELSVIWTTWGERYVIRFSYRRHVVGIICSEKNMADVIELVESSATTSEELARLVKCSGQALQLLYVRIASDVVIDTSQAGQGRSPTVFGNTRMYHFPL